MRPIRILLVPAAAALLLASLGACSGNSSEPPSTTTDGATTSASPSESASTTAAPTDDGGATSGTGCAATDASVPENAAVGPTADLDGDGQADELWLADDGDVRTLGVRTASGAVFSTDFTSAAPQAATAFGQVLGDGSAIVLLDTGRAVPLYAVVDCALVETQNEQGEQYTFDKGFTGYGTGVGCVDADDAGLALVGYLAETEGEETTVTTTQIELSDGGASASNGQETVEKSLPSDDPLVTAASTVGCGDAEPVHEPES